MVQIYCLKLYVLIVEEVLVHEAFLVEEASLAEVMMLTEVKEMVTHFVSQVFYFMRNFL